MKESFQETTIICATTHGFLYFITMTDAYPIFLFIILMRFRTIHPGRLVHVQSCMNVAIGFWHIQWDDKRKHTEPSLWYAWILATSGSTWIPWCIIVNDALQTLHLRFSKASTDHGFLAAWQFDVAVCRHTWGLESGLKSNLNSERKLSFNISVGHPIINQPFGMILATHYYCVSHIAPRKWRCRIVHR